MNLPGKRLAPFDALTSVVERSREESALIRERTREYQKQIARLGSELMELVGTDPETLGVSECSSQASRIKKKRQELAQALLGLTSPHLLVARGLAPPSTPFWEELFPSLLGLEEPFQQAYNDRRLRQQEEDERQARAQAFAEEEAFDADIKARLRAGEDVDVAYEQQMFNLRRQQGSSYLSTTSAAG